MNMFSNSFNSKLQLVLLYFMYILYISTVSRLKPEHLDLNLGWPSKIA